MNVVFRTILSTQTNTLEKRNDVLFTSPFTIPVTIIVTASLATALFITLYTL